jgi:hypothetical protein
VTDIVRHRVQSAGAELSVLTLGDRRNPPLVGLKLHAEPVVKDAQVPVATTRETVVDAPPAQLFEEWKKTHPRK